MILIPGILASYPIRDQNYDMDPEYRKVLELVKNAHHILWDEFSTPIRHLLCDLFLDGLISLDYYKNRPYCFTINDDGRRALQAIEMGYV